MLTDFTSYDQIRAVLGISIDEVEDVVLDLPMYYVLLSEDLLTIDDSIESDFINQKNPTTSSNTPQSKRFVAIMEVYAAYKVASILLTTAGPLVIPKTITADKDTVDRESPKWESILQNVNDSLAQVRASLLKAYNAFDSAVAVPASVTRTFMSSTGLAVDPVTTTS